MSFRLLWSPQLVVPAPAPFLAVPRVLLSTLILLTVCRCQQWGKWESTNSPSSKCHRVCPFKRLRVDLHTHSTRQELMNCTRSHREEWKGKHIYGASKFLMMQSLTFTASWELLQQFGFASMSNEEKAGGWVGTGSLWLILTRASTDPEHPSCLVIFPVLEIQNIICIHWNLPPPPTHTLSFTR